MKDEWHGRVHQKKKLVSAMEDMFDEWECPSEEW